MEPYPKGLESLKFRAFLLWRGLRDAIRGTPINEKTFTRTTFDRMKGLDVLLERCQGSSILDIGSCDGLVSYEFARHGARLVHGFDFNVSDIAFAMKLFRAVPIESAFAFEDLTIGAEKLFKKHAVEESYDIVLYLGVHHHLRKQMQSDQLSDLLEGLLTKSRKYFAVRTNMVRECEQQILGSGFKLIHRDEGAQRLGALRIYERCS